MTTREHVSRAVLDITFAVTLVVLCWRGQDIHLRVVSISETLEDCDRSVRRADESQRKLVKMLDRLDRRVRYPRFDAHCAKCSECNGEETADGPSPLCEEGFELLKDDMRAERRRLQ